MFLLFVCSGIRKCRDFLSSNGTVCVMQCPSTQKFVVSNGADTQCLSACPRTSPYYNASNTTLQMCVRSCDELADPDKVHVSQSRPYVVTFFFAGRYCTNGEVVLSCW
jgi:hypothetical protein